MAQILVKRGLQADLLADTLDEGEIGYATDTRAFYVGSTTGPVLAGRAFSGPTANRADHDDIEGCFFYDETLGKTYLRHGTSWIDLTTAGSAGLLQVANNLSDVADAATARANLGLSAEPAGRPFQIIHKAADGVTPEYFPAEYLGGYERVYSNDIDFPAALTGRTEMCMAAYGSKLYMGLGVDPSGVYKNDWHSYDFTTRQWAVLNTCPQARAGAGCVTVVTSTFGVRIYVTHGRTGAGAYPSINQTHWYQVTSNANSQNAGSWYTATGVTGTVPSARDGFGMCAYSSGGVANFLMGFGANGSSLIADMQSFAPSQSGGAWTVVTAPPAGLTARKGVAMTSYLSKVYVGLGYSAEGAMADWWELDRGGPTWTQKASPPGAARSYPAYGPLGLRAAAGFGVDAAGAPLDDLYIYDMLLNTWSQQWTPAGSGRKLGGSTAYADRIYFGGGRDAADAHVRTLNWQGKAEAGVFTFAGLERAVMDYNGLIVKDTTAQGNMSKAFRFRVTGGACDFDCGGTSMYASTYASADFSGTQNNIWQASATGVYSLSAATSHMSPGQNDFTGMYSGLSVYRSATSPVALRVVANKRGTDGDFAVKRRFKPRAWDELYNYSLGDYAIEPLVGLPYRSLQSDNRNHALTDAAWWVYDVNLAHWAYRDSDDGAAPMALAYDAVLDNLSVDAPMVIRKPVTAPAWSPTSLYAVNSVVWWAGSLYKAHTAVTALPAAWSAATTYGVGGQVSHNGAQYKSTKASNLNHAVVDAGWWAPESPATITSRWATFNDMSSLALSYDQAASDTFNFNAANHVFGVDPGAIGGELVRVGGSVKLSGNLSVGGSAKVGDDAASAGASNVGSLRYKSNISGTPGASWSSTDMCMQTGAASYAWVNIITNTW